MKILMLAVLLFISSVNASEPLRFIAVDCTQYGSVEEPALIMSFGDGEFMLGPLSALPNEGEVQARFNQLLRENAYNWYDKRCDARAI